jgi:hypothetical protein
MMVPLKIILVETCFSSSRSHPNWKQTTRMPNEPSLYSIIISDQDCTAIFGLADLNTEVTLKDGSVITLRTLLKSLPASPGMVRTRLFQVVDPNAAQDCVLVTFQRCDRPFIEDRKFEL